MNLILSMLAGMVFGVGLIVSGMSNPAKVIAFLNIAGKWDPSLALVMGGAIAVGVVAYALARGREKSWLGCAMPPAAVSHIDRQLLIGCALFGIGWGLAGICPGPSLLLVGAGYSKGVLFFVTMLAGMTAFEANERWVQVQRGAA